jgi:hypothetical protein
VVGLEGLRFLGSVVAMVISSTSHHFNR